MRPLFSATARTCFCALCLFTLSHPPAIANTWTVRGRVVDKENLPIIGASVTTNAPSVGAVTDSAGTFMFSGAGGSGAPGFDGSDRPILLTVSHLGFAPRMLEIAAESERLIVIQLTPTVIVAPGMTVYADPERTAIADSRATISTTDIARDYQIGDMPQLVASTPNVDAFSDAGGGLGYSYISIRGFANERVRAHINGVPLNDPEDQFTYFVDHPDFAGNVSAIQVQRGIGVAPSGEESFGGAVNVITYALDEPRRVMLTTAMGAFEHDGKFMGDFSKSSAQFASGLIDGKWNMSGRFSRQSSGGYRENSDYNGWAYFLSVSRLYPKSTTMFTTFGGPMRLHLAYLGADRDRLATNRRYNPLDYRGETDNFNQPQLQAHNTYQISERSRLQSTLYYIRGVGYYEQEKRTVDVAEYGFAPLDFGDTTGQSIADRLVRQQWVRKNQFGFSSEWELTEERNTHTLGVSGYVFDSDHWGQVESVTGAPSDFIPGRKYYQYFGDKRVFTVYTNESHRFSAKLSGAIGAQVTHVHARVDQTALGAFSAARDYSRSWTFLSPRLSLNYAPRPGHAVHARFGVASRVPRDADIYDANDPDATINTAVKPERILALETGYELRHERTNAGLNLYWMSFDNEVIYYGVDTDGARLTDNAPHSYKAGIELYGAWIPTSRLRLNGNLSFNRNRFTEYRPFIATYDGSFAALPSQRLDFHGNTAPGFPSWLGNLIFDYHTGRVRVTYRLRGVGKQFMDPANLDSLAIDPHFVSSFTLGATLLRSVTFGAIDLTLTVDNAFNALYEQSGYGGVYAIRATPTDPPVTYGWAEYFPSAGRSILAQIRASFE